MKEIKPGCREQTAQDRKKIQKVTFKYPGNLILKPPCWLQDCWQFPAPLNPIVTLQIHRRTRNNSHLPERDAQRKRSLKQTKCAGIRAHLQQNFSKDKKNGRKKKYVKMS